jgi:hypothetical protein
MHAQAIIYNNSAHLLDLFSPLLVSHKAGFAPSRLGSSKDTSPKCARLMDVTLNNISAALCNSRLNLQWLISKCNLLVASKDARIGQNEPSRIGILQTPSDRYFEALVLIPLCSLLMHRSYGQVLKVVALSDRLCSQHGQHYTFSPSSLGDIRGRIMAAAPCLMNLWFHDLWILRSNDSV